MLLRPGGFAVRGDNTIGAGNSMQLVGIYTTPAALVSQRVVRVNALHAQLEAINRMELLGTAEACGEFGRFPEADRELMAPPLWMRSTLKDFTVGWRRTLAPTPRPMNMNGPISTGSMRWQLHLGGWDQPEACYRDHS
jgi:hypothetical protein